MARLRVLTTTLAIVGVVCALGTPVAATAPDPQPAAAALAGPIQFGAAQAAVPGKTKVQAIQALEGVAGRQLAVIRVYDLWNTPFPDATATWLKSTGHTMFLSVRAKRTNGQVIRWADIAAARPGDPLYTDMVRWADAIKAYGAPMYFSFNHEPETTVSAPSGNATAYIAAWQNFVGVFRARGVTNATHAWTTAVRNFSVATTSPQYAPKFYPGDAWVDHIAIDAYNMYCLRKDGQFSRPWRSLQQLLEPFMAFAALHPTPSLIVAEFGSPEDPAQSQRKEQWLDQARLLFQQPAYARFRAVAYWNQLSHNFEGCDFRVTSSTAAQQAFVRMAQDPYYSAP